MIVGDAILVQGITRSQITLRTTTFAAGVWNSRIPCLNIVLEQSFFAGLTRRGMLQYLVVYRASKEGAEWFHVDWHGHVGRRSDLTGVGANADGGDGALEKMSVGFGG